MPIDRTLINSLMVALIDGNFGCLDAAAETINAYHGTSVGKGTLSKRLAGHNGWPVEDIVALEDASGRKPVTRMLARRLDPRGDTAAASLTQSSGVAAKEAGEAISAALRAAQSAGSDDRAEALREVSEAIEALVMLRRALEVAG